MNEIKIVEQERVLNATEKNIIVSASAGSGKTHVMVKYITNLIALKHISVKRLLVMTFTKKAAGEMKLRIEKSLKNLKQTKEIIEQLDALPLANIATIDSVCEKLIKKYINSLDIAVNFEICDENYSKSLKRKAFLIACENFKTTQEESYIKLVAIYGLDNDVLFEFMQKLNNFCDSTKNAQALIENAIIKNDYLICEAERVISENLDYCLEQISERCLKLLSVNDDIVCLKEILNSCEDVKKQSSLSYKYNALSSYKYTKTPDKNKIGLDVACEITAIKEEIKKLKLKLEELGINEIDIKELNSDVTLQKVIWQLYNEYQETYSNLKKQQNLLDFSDLEKYALLVVNMFKDEIAEQYDYVFVDEYQDTNKIQEEIIKGICSKAHFFAVGDAKQGIYGFRNASVDIILDDIEKFSKQKDSKALNLKNNFRSNHEILDFINKVFEKNMTVKNSRIDYAGTSMLKGMQQFGKSSLPSVRVDVVCPNENLDFKDGRVLYSVRADNYEKNSVSVEYYTILARINECLKSTIYDLKLKDFRKVKFSDIVLLSRKRNSNFENLEKFLVSKGLPIFSDRKFSIMQEGEIEILLNLAKFCLNRYDDVTLTSLLLSHFGKFTVSELANIRLTCSDKSFYEVFYEQKNEKKDRFLSLMDKFDINCKVKGIYFAYVDIINECGFMAYLLSQNKIEAYSCVNDFLETIKDFKPEHDIVEFLSYMQSTDIDMQNRTAEDNQILLTTIHASKGLEYPIVIIVDAGDNIRSSPNNIEIDVSQDFGLSTKVYDLENQKKYVGIKQRASKINSAKKDFAGELMILYVAMTRAKNNLFIIGQEDKGKLGRQLNSYIDIILNSLTESEFSTFINTEQLHLAGCEICYIDDVIYNDKDGDISDNFEKLELNDSLKDYLTFKDKTEELNKLPKKNSVTSLLQQEFSQSSVQNSNTSKGSSAEEGILYHKAMELAPFDKIENIDDVENFLVSNPELVGVDKEIIYKNIMLIKPFLKDAKIYKEQEFLMRDKICKLSDKNSDEIVHVQGIIDLFIKGKENILIDFKYTSLNDEEKIISKYKTQIRLYKLALEKKFNEKVQKSYILSLKYAKLIKIY